MPDQFAEAIEARRQLSFRYDGLPRVVMPAVYGYTTAGHLVLRAFQVGGLSRSSREHGWRTFTVSRISSCHVMEEGFTVDPPGYRRGDAAFSSTIAQL